jgi:hypothetical protein
MEVLYVSHCHRRDRRHPGRRRARRDSDGHLQQARDVSKSVQNAFAQIEAKAVGELVFGGNVTDEGLRRLVMKRP